MVASAINVGSCGFMEDKAPLLHDDFQEHLQRALHVLIGASDVT